MIRGLIIVVFLLGSFCSFAQSTFSLYDSLKGALTPERKCFDVTYYDLFLEVDVPQKRISGNNQVHYLVKEDFRKLQIDLYSNLRIDSILSGTNKLCFTRDSNAVYVSFPEKQVKGTRNYLTVYYQGKPIEAVKAPWDGGFVWSKDSLGNDWVGVACEGMGASLWWPCKDHPSDEPDSMSVSVKCPANYQCISNGNQIHSIKTADGSEVLHKWKINYPINTYNVTLNIGKYAHFPDTLRRKDNTTLPLDYYVLTYNLDKAKIHFEQVKKILEGYEHYFGKYPFPKDGYALIETPYWGMEHQSAISYGNHYKNDLGTLDFIILHETAHEWWGNNITAADMGNLWIHESFATYAESLLIEYYYGKEQANKYLLYQRKKIENKQPLILPQGVSYFNPDDTDIYYKGAWVLHTLRTVINNDKKFFGILLNLQNKFRHSIVDSKELLSFISKQAKMNLSPLFEQYLKYTSLPMLEYDFKKEKGKTTLVFRWKTEVKDFEMPLIIESKGKKIRKQGGRELKRVVLDSEAEFRILDELELIEFKRISYF